MRRPDRLTVSRVSSLQDPFTDVLEKLDITDPFVTNWLNLLCFLLQGLPSSGTTTAVMSYMIADWCRPVSDVAIEIYRRILRRQGCTRHPPLFAGAAAWEVIAIINLSRPGKSPLPFQKQTK